MTNAAFSAPKQWEDWVSWVLGIWLCLSPWILAFSLEATPTANAVTSGFLIILAEVVTLSAFRVWEEWINVVLGLWLVGSPWFLDIASSAARLEFIVVGILVVALALYEMKQSRRSQGSHK